MLLRNLFQLIVNDFSGRGNNLIFGLSGRRETVGELVELDVPPSRSPGADASPNRTRNIGSARAPNQDSSPGSITAENLSYLELAADWARKVNSGEDNDGQTKAPQIFKSSFHSIFCSSFGPSLPLHVGGRVVPAALQWLPMIDDVAQASPGYFSGGWAWILALEG